MFRTDFVCLNYFIRLSARCGLRHYSKDLERPLGKDSVPRTNSKEPLGTGSVSALPPLSEPMPDLPPVVFSTAKAENTLTEVTVLSNGLRVASEKKFGQFCTAGGKQLYRYLGF